jgi:hypothetical protein
MPKSKHQTAGRNRSIYEFIKAHRDRDSVQMMCRVLEVAVSGYYQWLRQPISNHDQEDARLVRLTHRIFKRPFLWLELYRSPGRVVNSRLCLCDIITLVQHSRLCLMRNPLCTGRLGQSGGAQEVPYDAARSNSEPAPVRLA